MTHFSSCVAAVLLAFGLAVSAHASCNPTCRFSFCPQVHNNVFNIGQPDKAFTTAICDPTGVIHVGHVDSTGEAYVRAEYGYVPISQYKPAGLQQHFSPSFFKSYGIYEYGKDISGIGHETPQTNQAQYLNNLCVSVPLTAYQVLDKPYGNVIDNRHPSNRYVDCVSFTTNVPSPAYSSYSSSSDDDGSSGSEAAQPTEAPRSAGGEISDEGSSETSPEGSTGPTAPRESTEASHETSSEAGSWGETAEETAEGSGEVSSEATADTTSEETSEASPEITGEETSSSEASPEVTGY